MTEKVKLPKAVCDALDYAKFCQLDELDIVATSYLGKWKNDAELIPLHDFDSKLLMRALVLGYEAELTAEERIKALFKNPPIANTSLHEIYQYAIRDTLKIYNIHYDWLDGDNQ